ncbi:MAG: hypothetical protein RJA44_769 [Pseudomonadota bacterium]|jgi:negative regulator of flagellin synthesis FlgM
MKIGNTAAPVGVSPASTALSHGLTPNGKPAATASEAGPTTVQISSAAKMLADSADEGFDIAKIEQIRQAIANGEFRINAEAIADKLLANAHELLSRTGSTG